MQINPFSPLVEVIEQRREVPSHTQQQFVGGKVIFVDTINLGQY